jgi:autotransporter-associated beta strand protein
MTTSFRTFICCALSSAVVCSVFAADVFKGDNTTPLNQTGSWVGGAVPGAADVAAWDAAVTGANAVDIGGALTWDGLRIATPGGPVTISGAARLTLDGGAAADIDLSAASQDLTLNTPVTLSGAQALDVGTGRALTFNGLTLLPSGSLQRGGGGTLVFNGLTTNSVASTYAAGRTVFAGPTRGTGVISLQGGDVAVWNEYVSTSGDLEVYNGTLVLDAASAGLSMVSRFFVGRNFGPITASDGLMIVSNGVHAVNGGNADSTSSFIGVSGAVCGRLFVESGSLSSKYLRLSTNNKAGSGDRPDELRVNGGLLSVTDSGTLAFMMGTRHDNSIAEASRSGLLEVAGGRFEIPNGTTLISTDGGSTQAQTLDVVLSGGTWAVKKITVGSKAQAAKRFWFNGGTLEATNAAAGSELIDGSSVNATFTVQARGLRVDSGSGSVRLSVPLAEDPASPGGKLVKLGSGTLTLGGSMGFAGPLVVSNGTLKIEAALAETNLVVAGGAAFSLADGALTVFRPTSLKLGSAAQAARLDLEVAAEGTACDQFVLPAGAWLQQAAVGLYVQGTATPLARAGDFPVLKYAGGVPSMAALSWATPVAGFACTFEVDPDTQTVCARLSAVPVVEDLSGYSVWTAPGGGDWQTAGNWDAAPSSMTGTRVWFGSAATAPATVTLAAPFKVGAVVFDNSSAYTLSGTGGLTLNNGVEPTTIAVSNGAHTVALPVTPAATPVFRTETGTSLTLDGVVGGSAGLVKQGGGELFLNAANTYGGQTTVQGGLLTVQAASALGTGQVNLSGGKLKVTGSGPVVLTNTLVVATSGSAIEAAAPTELTGALDWASGQSFYKDGSAELVFKGVVSESGNNSLKLFVRQGDLRFAQGANVSISHSSRETIDMSAATTGPRTLTVDTGATVQAGGLLTGSGPSNTVHVNGGSLTLTGSASEAGLVRLVTDLPGSDRIIVDAGAFTVADGKWLSLGVRGGGAEIIVNGGTATIGLLSLGTRNDVGFASTGLPTYGRVEVNGGVLDIVGTLNWMGDVNPNRTNMVFLNGGTLRLPSTFRSASAAVANRCEFTLNGGTLALTGLGTYGETSLDNYLSGLNLLYVGQGGAIIDTLGNSATVTQAVRRAGSTTGGFVKRGAGTLTLAAPCDYVGATVVEAGTLRALSSVASAALAVSNNAAFSLRSGVFDTLTLDSAALAPGARLDFDVATDSDACDQIALPSGAAVEQLVVGLYNLGTLAPVTRMGTFPLFAYSGTPPDVSGWTLAPEMFGVGCTFAVNAGAQTIDAQLSLSDTQATWASTGSGDWSVPGNWSPLAPAASGATVRFGSALAGAATVNVDGPVSVAGMIFDHTFGYALDGSAVTLANGAAPAFIQVRQATHTLSNAVTLADGVIVSVATGATLRVADEISGSGALTVEGGGTLSLEGVSTRPAVVRGGATVTVPTVAALGGADLTLDNGTLAVAASDELGGNVALGNEGGALASATGATLQLTATVTGAGGLTKTGAGTVVLSADALGYAGATVSGGGTLSTPDLPSGALVLGGGTFLYTGVSDASSQPVTLASGSRAAVLRTASDLTLSGPVATRSGAFYKGGAGTVAFAGAATNVFGATETANPNGLAAPGADGDGPDAGCGVFNVAEGRVVLGAAGQVNRIPGRLLVGLNTTAAADAETAGELVIAGGETVCAGWTGIGRGNGTTTTAPGGRSSRITVQDGTFRMTHLSLGGAAGFADYTGRPELEIQGGTVEVDDLFYVGETLGGVSTVRVSGGTLRHIVSASSTSMRLGNSGGEGILRVTAGTAEFARDVILALGGAGSTGTVELAGGVLSCQNLYKWTSPATGYGRMLFNGGVYRPFGGGLNNSFNECKIGAGPAILDTSLVTADAYALDAVLTGADVTDGGFVKTGAGTVNVNAAQAYSGPTGVSNGVLRVTASGALPAASALTVAPGARLAVNNVAAKQVVLSGLTLGDAAEATPAEILFGIDSVNATNDQFVVNGDVTVHHAAFHLYWQSSASDQIVANGTYTLLRWTGNGPATAAGFSVANPMAGKKYTFAISGKTLRLDVAAATEGADAYVWSAAGGGNWSDGAKWVAAPGAGASGMSVRLDASLTAAATVQLDQAAALGGLYFNSANAYTVAGANTLTLDNGAAPAVVQVEKGGHVVAAPLAVQAAGAELKPISGAALTLAAPVSGEGGLVKMNGGMLTLATNNTFSGGLRLTGGALTLTNGADVGTGALAVEINTSVRVSGTVPSVLPGPLALRAATPSVNVDSGARLTIAGGLQYDMASTLAKQGAGELTLAGQADAADDNDRLNLQEGTLRFAAGALYRIGAAHREVVRMDADNNRARTLAVDAGARAALAGLYVGYGTNTVVVDGRLDLKGTNDAVCLRIQSSAAEDRFTVRSGGVVTSPQIGWFNIGVRGPARVAVEGGTAQLGRVALGYQNGGVAYGGLFGTVLVNGGGLLDVTGSWNWMGDLNNAARLNQLVVGDGTLAGGTARLPATYRSHAQGWSSLILDNGTLTAAGAGLTAPTAGDYLAGLVQLYVSGAGGTFDTAGQTVAISQPVGTDRAGGTLAKQGQGSLTFAQPLRWAGTVDVQAGALAASVLPGVTQTFPAGLLGRYGFEAGPVRDTSGNGRHGVVRGATQLAPGTNGVYGLMFDTGQSSVCVPCDAAIRGMDTFTVAMWLWVNSVTAAAATPTTFFTTRLNTGSTGPYEFMIRMHNDKVRFMTTGNTAAWSTSYDSTLGLPGSNRWAHVACVVTPNGLTMYINGALAGASTAAAMKTTLFIPPTRPLTQYGFGIGHYHVDTPQSGQFKGRFDDVRVYGVALSQAEVQQLVASAPELPELRVAGGASFAAQGACEVKTLTGEGHVAGAVTVRERVAPGDAADAPAGAVLMAEDLTLAAGAVYGWDYTPGLSDELITGHLTIGGAGVIDCGRDAGDPVTGPFRAVLMRYDTIEGAANLANWTLTNVGRTGFDAKISAANNEVALDFISVRGTVMLLR